MAGETALYGALSGDSNITGIVSDRIYSDIRDQGDILPAIYFERSGTEFINTIDSFAPQGEKSSFIVSCFETTREKSEALSAYIISATATTNFLCIDKQNSFDEETETFTTTMQFDYLDLT